MPICPNGHQSGTDDWCEVCGMRMTPPASPASSHGSRPPSSYSSSSASPASAPPASPSPPGFDGDPTAVAELCPQCGTPREGAALFCEECRYNFRTRSASAPPYVPPAAVPPTVVPPTAVPPGYPPYQRHESQRSRPSQINRPAEPVPSESLTLASGSGDFLLDPPSTPAQRPAPAAVPGPDPAAAAAASASSTATSVSQAPSSVPTVVPAQPGRGTAWTAVVATDREYFTAMMARSGPEAQGLYFPAFSPELQVPLTGNQITIGRRRHSTGEAPDIDLSRAPEDPGVSHKHAVLVQQPDGAWAVVDQDSTNGTTVNLGEDPIRPYTPVPLADGDRVHVGAWTTITVRRA